MSLPRSAVGLLGLLASVAPAAAVHVTLERPAPGLPVFGEVEVEARVASEAGVRSLQLIVDQRFVGRLAEPPYRWLVDVGEGNSEHRFEVMAEDEEGRTALSVLVTPAIRVDTEISVSLQQLYVSVTRDGRPVTDRQRAHFLVEDLEERQRLVTFERGDVPLTALLLPMPSASSTARRSPSNSKRPTNRACSGPTASSPTSSCRSTFNRRPRRWRHQREARVGLLPFFQLRWVALAPTANT